MIICLLMVSSSACISGTMPLNRYRIQINVDFPTFRDSSGKRWLSVEVMWHVSTSFVQSPEKPFVNSPPCFNQKNKFHTNPWSFLRISLQNKMTSIPLRLENQPLQTMQNIHLCLRSDLIRSAATVLLSYPSKLVLSISLIIELLEPQWA